MATRPTIRHVVFFTAKDQADLQRIKDGLSVLKDIPHANVVEVAENLRVDTLGEAVDVVVYAEFDSPEALDAYKAHPLYTHSISLVRPLRDLRIAADF